ncbi:response regulator [Ideonella sp. B7]|uniref:response regulator n=1 Tax=Ideonella benzenivorans TaxID=2831643 RepID=UPI001CED6170|nr:response regulator [Ideonella benzenivorans]MCA6215859.1 response regulator [Ideonella benzenivorans]
MTRILFLDGDTELTGMLAQYLGRERLEVDAIFDGQAGVQAALSGRYALVVLDLMLPRHSGIEVLRHIRASSQIPVLMLSTGCDDFKQLMAPEMGTEACMPKPCEPAELARRIHAILGRQAPGPSVAPPSGPDLLQVGRLELRIARGEAIWNGQRLELTGVELSLLTELARSAGDLITKDEMSRRAFGKPLAPYDRHIDVCLANVRRKLGLRPDGQPWIQRVRDSGYQFLAG